MMAKIVKGSDFKGVVDYILDKGKGTQVVAYDGLFMENKETIAMSFNAQSQMNNKVTKPVGHIALSFSKEDEPRLTNRIMAGIALEYMERMGIVDTPFIIVRHLDKDYPHCHLVFSRVDNHGETISDNNDFNRNRKVCLDLTKEYGLHISEGKAQTKVNKLRGNEKTRYEIFNAVNDAWNDKDIYTFEQFENCLKAAGVGVELKYRRGTNQVQGLWFTRKGKKFPASKIDRKFSFANLSKHLSKNTPLHPKS